MLNTCWMFSLIVGYVASQCVKLNLLEFFKCLLENYSIITEGLTQSINFNLHKCGNTSLPRPQDSSLRSFWAELLLQAGNKDMSSPEPWLRCAVVSESSVLHRGFVIVEAL